MDREIAYIHWNEIESKLGTCRWCNQSVPVRDCYCGLLAGLMVKGICKPCYRKIDKMVTPRYVAVELEISLAPPERGGGDEGEK